MTGKVLVFQHMAEESDNLIVDMLRDDGFSLDYAHVHEGTVPETNGHDLLLVLGGIQNTWQTEKYPWLKPEIEIIRDWVEVKARPYIGICLGHQLLAEALGGTVGKAETGETGMHRISRLDHDHPFFERLPTETNVMQWHGAEVKNAPSAAKVLASSSTTGNQAMAIGDHALSVQFHMEWTHDAITNWPKSWVKAMDEERGEGGHDELLKHISPHMPAINDNTRRIYRNFMKTSGLLRL